MTTRPIHGSWTPGAVTLASATLGALGRESALENLTSDVAVDLTPAFSHRPSRAWTGSATSRSLSRCNGDLQHPAISHLDRSSDVTMKVRCDIPATSFKPFGRLPC